jgi:uncharacterized protein (TIGR03067 family)
MENEKPAKGNTEIISRSRINPSGKFSISVPHWLVCLILFCFAHSALATGQEGPPELHLADAEKSIIGVWHANGQSTCDTQPFHSGSSTDTFVIGNGTLTMYSCMRIEQYFFKLNSTKDPAEISWIRHSDYYPVVFDRSDDKWLGIYRIHGDTLELCYTESSESHGRPVKFCEKADAGQENPVGVKSVTLNRMSDDYEAVAEKAVHSAIEQNEREMQEYVNGINKDLEEDHSRGIKRHYSNVLMLAVIMFSALLLVWFLAPGASVFHVMVMFFSLPTVINLLALTVPDIPLTSGLTWVGAYVTLFIGKPCAVFGFLLVCLGLIKGPLRPYWKRYTVLCAFMFFYWVILSFVVA